jgi:hypothetical protein
MSHTAVFYFFSDLRWNGFKYIAVTVKVERNCHFPSPGWTHRQALGFPDTSRVSLHKSNKSFAFFVALPTGIREVTVALNFVSDSTIVAQFLGPIHMFIKNIFCL